MKTCPTCRTPYPHADALHKYCLKDGTMLVSETPSGFDSQPDTLSLSPSSSDSIAEVATLFPPCTNNQNLSGLWLSQFTYNVSRNGKPVGGGFQIDVELLVPGSQPSLFGSNLLCSSNTGKLYKHELRAQILGNYLLGSWFNTNTQNIGAFQLYIHTHKCIMSGKHIGNANDNSIPHGDWTWIKIEGDSNYMEEQAAKLKGSRLKPIAELGKNFKLWTKAAVPLKIEWLVEF
jgi:hypothetical protein